MKTRRSTLWLIPLTAAFLPLIWFVWIWTQKPPMIPLHEWEAPGDPIFPLSQTDPDEMQVALAKDDLLNANDFVFTMGVGSGMFGLDVFRVDAQGHAEYVFSTGEGEWWQAAFKLRPAEVLKLRQLLVDVDYGSLARGYHADICDGTQWCIRIDVAGLTKKVYCNNYFPEAAKTLAAAVGRDILPIHEFEIKRARRIWESTRRKAAAGLWS